MGGNTFDIEIQRGRTFEFAYRRADMQINYAPISGMPSTTPVRLTAPNHGIPDGWRVGVEKVIRPEELNTSSGDYYIATFIDANTIELNGVRTDDWRPFVTSGALYFNRPFDLTGCSARMQVRRTLDGPVLLSLSSDPQAVRDGEIELDVSLSSIIVRLSAAATAAITWTRAVYDIELITAEGHVQSVTPVSAVSILPEVTR